MSVKILYLEDDAVSAILFQKFFCKRGYSVDVASDFLQGLEQAEITHFDLIVSDFRFPDGTAVDFLQALHKTLPEYAHVPSIIVSADVVNLLNTPIPEDLNITTTFFKPLSFTRVLEYIDFLMENRLIRGCM